MLHFFLQRGDSPITQETDGPATANSAVIIESGENTKREASHSDENEAVKSEAKQKLSPEEIEGKEEPEEAKEDSAEQENKESTDLRDRKDPNPPEIPPTSTVETVTTALASESDAVQTSAQSISENSTAAAAADQNISEKPREVQTSGPDTSEAMSGHTEDVKRPVTEPSYVKKVGHVNNILYHLKLGCFHSMLKWGLGLIAVHGMKCLNMSAVKQIMEDL